jgi:hypothetical protein
VLGGIVPGVLRDKKGPSIGFELSRIEGLAHKLVAICEEQVPRLRGYDWREHRAEIHMEQDFLALLVERADVNTGLLRFAACRMVKEVAAIRQEGGIPVCSALLLAEW